MRHYHQRVLLVACLVAPALAYSEPNLTTEDSIQEADRTNFVSFDGLAPGAANEPVYVEDGVFVEQIGGEGNEIWSMCGTGFCWNSNDTQSWYPNGGDNGVTQISRVDGSDFVNFGVDIGGGGFLANENTIGYTLLLDGAIVLSGSVGMFLDGYIGFLGGGFDTIQLNSDGGGFFLVSNVLAIDNIELSGGAEPEELLEELGTAVTGVGPGNSLADKIMLAQTFLAVPDVQSTCAMLADFLNQVRAQRGKKLTLETADQLTADAQAIMDAIGCN